LPFLAVLRERMKNQSRVGMKGLESGIITLQIL
jgi:hypothetical protein